MPIHHGAGRRRSGHAIFWAAGSLVLALLSCTLLPEPLNMLLSVSNRDLPPGTAADGIIVLGYALFRSGEATEPLKGRVAAGVQAYLQGRGKNIIFSGAHPEAPGGSTRETSEANVMLRYAAQLGGSAAQGPDRCQRWLLEEASTSTRENAVNSLKMASERGWSSLLIVTNQFHQQRSLWTFEKAAQDLGLQPVPEFFVCNISYVGHKGYELLGYGHPAIDAVVDVWDWLREVLAIALYWAKGYI